jgi:uncharacterized protein
MTDPTSAQHCWYELQTTDAPAAAAFYSQVVGWTLQQHGEGAGAYRVLTTPKGGVAGIASLPPGAGKPHWLGYLAVPDVDAYAANVVAEGGTVTHPPTDVPGMLRFAIVADPQGVGFGILKGFSDEPPPVGAPGEPGFVGWHELMTKDGTAAFDFYSKLFGWKATGSHDMGPVGVYLLWTDGRAGDAGGMMTTPPDMQGGVWNYYFRVDSTEAAAKRLTEAGGKVLIGPMQVPDGLWIVQAVDPQGAGFSCVSAVK